MKKPLLIVLLCLGASLMVIVGASIGVSVQALRITGKPQTYISLAKLVASLESEDWGRFHGTIIETVESAEMHRRATERVRTLHPDVKESDTKIIASQIRGSNIYTVRASGSDPKYTRVFLDALLDEFMAFWSSSPPPKHAQSVKIMERASGAVEDLQDWAAPIAIGLIAGGLGGLILSLLIAVPIYSATRTATPPALPPAG